MKKIAKTKLILFGAILCVSSILLINMIAGYINIDHTENNQVITSEKYRNVEIAPRARGEITKEAIDDIIEDHETENIKIIAVRSEDNIKMNKIIMLVIIMLISSGGTLLCWREMKEGNKINIR